MSQVSKAYENQLLRSLHEENLVSFYLENDSGEEIDLEGAQDTDELGEVSIEPEYEWSEPVSERTYNGFMDFVLHVLTDMKSDYLGEEGEICLNPENEYPDGFAVKGQLKPRDFRHLAKKYPDTEFEDQNLSEEDNNLSRKLKVLNQYAEKGDQSVSSQGLTEDEIESAIRQMEPSETWKNTNLS